jgi:hypothetical protein
MVAFSKPRPISITCKLNGCGHPLYFLAPLLPLVDDFELPPLRVDE